jgi:hypothetical protein
VLLLFRNEELRFVSPLLLLKHAPEDSFNRLLAAECMVVQCMLSISLSKLQQNDQSLWRDPAAADKQAGPEKEG